MYHDAYFQLESHCCAHLVSGLLTGTLASQLEGPRFHSRLPLSVWAQQHAIRSDWGESIEPKLYICVNVGVSGCLCILYVTV